MSDPSLPYKLLQAVQLFQRALAKFDPPTTPNNATSNGSSTGLNSDAPSHRLGLGRCHILRTRLCAALLKALIEEGRGWQSALVLARELSSSYKMVRVCIRRRTSFVCLFLLLKALSQIDLEEQECVGAGSGRVRCF